MAIGAKDKKGLIQYGISFGVSMATVQRFKHTADRWRPTYTGFSRVHGQKHFAGDALSGASIAMLSTLAFVTPVDPERAAYFADMERYGKWRFESEMYKSDVTENWVQGPGDTGTLLDFRFDQNSNPTINGAAAAGGGGASRFRQ